jgi:hypothetical protein
MAKKKENKRTEIHLVEHSDTCFELEASGNAQSLDNAIISLHAWFMQEYVHPDDLATYITHVTGRLIQKAKNNPKEMIGVDLKDLLKQMKGENNG